uniref:Glycosyltransferase 61 catalytic domain-containing protein n=1 Tax=Aegilops tauschii TaxID=37682 RepID=M8AQV5_AEGTA
MKKARRNESGKKLASRAGARAIVWLLLPILVFVLLNADYMPQVPRLTGTSVTEAAEYFRQSTHKVPSSGIEDTIWQQQERLLHDVAKFRAEHDSVVEAPPSRESSHEMAGKLVGADRGTESAIWQQQRQLLREVAELRAAHKELLLEVAKLRAAHDLAVRAPPSPASTDETPGEAVDAQPSPPSSDETPGEAVHAQPSPASSNQTPGEAVEAPPSPPSSDETPVEAVEAPPFPTSNEETLGKANDAPPSPASNDETHSGAVDAQPSPPSSDETPGQAVEAPPSPTSSDETPGGVVDSKRDVAAPRSKSTCDFSGKRMDICAMEGDLRMHGKAATVYVVSASGDSYRPENGMVTIHPYPRKMETETMQTIREVTIRWNDPPGPDAPRCTVTHDVPALVFSTGGYLSNLFHAMTDGIIPLFNTVREYNGRVQLVVTDYNHEWVDKFRDILAALSNYPVIDFDADNEVRCFPSVHVGTESHKELGIIPALSRKGYTMTDFRDFLRSVYSLKREWSTPVNRASGDRPRLAMIPPGNPRAFAKHEEVRKGGGDHRSSHGGRIRGGAGRAGGHERHGPVVPWGDLSWASFSAFGAPTADMGLRYVKYEATAEETTLKYVYPRDHAVFTDVPSINKQGYSMTWRIFLNGQNITLDIDRFRGVLQQIYQSTIMADPVVEALPPPNEMPSEAVDANKDLKNEENGGADGSLIKPDVPAPRSKSSCDFRNERMDVCAMEGDVRMHGKDATVYVVSASDDSYRPENGVLMIHPYTRKWEPQTMQTVREVIIRWSDPPGPEEPRCTVTHDVPAVVFSSGGYLANFFHAMTDGIIPLFNTAREYNGRVQLVATDYDPKWIGKFRNILGALSNYPVIDFDADDEVRCFPSVRVGTESHKELGIIPALSRKGYTMTDFREFLRSAYSLKREWSTPVNRAAGDRPRLVMLLRRRSREFANEAEAIATATEVGFEVVPAGPEVVSDMAQFAEVVNSCDVIMGVHGAGLTNLVFLPRNGTVLQVVPWGDMRWASFSAFGAPTADMGLRYVEYEATAEETTLKYVYPRDHAVFTDPRSIQKQGFGVAWGTFFNGQNVTLDINRFRGVLQQIYHDSVLPDPSLDSAPVVEAPPSPGSSDAVDANRDLGNEKGLQAMNGGVDGSSIKSDVAAPRSKSSCDFRSERMDTCAMEGDVRMHGKAASVYVVSASDDSYRPESGTVTIHPYTRKWEPQTMQTVREVTIRWSAPPGPDPPGCTVTHDVPAVIFSSGGYLANFFHAMTDGIIPLFNTAREYEGRVQLVATDYDSKWLGKFKDILAALSIYPVIDFDADDEVRCFPSVRVGTESHKELGIIPALSRKGYTMTDFRDFLRSAYSLKREWATPVNITSGDRPRLVMVSRRRSREIANEAEAVATATEVGFEVVPAGPEVVSDMARFAEVVNSCDVILGVHGAGLTNLVFLPRNGTVMQIVPWGDMRWASFSAFGAPTADMGLRYVEYEATAEETTLKYIYPRNHTVFTDPRSIQRQGFGVAWETFFNGQNVTLDIDRFRGVMQQIYQSATIT